MKDIRVIHRTMTRLAAVVMTFMVMACSSIDEDFYFSDEPATGGATSGRELMEEERKVFILWSLGFNNLSSYLVSDLDDLTSGWLPGSTRKEDVVLAFCHNTAGAYSKQTSPVLMRIYRDLNGNAQRDTVLVLPKSTISASPETMEELAREGLVGRNGTPEDVAQSFLYLADASFVTGQVLPVNGGLIL